MKKEELYDVIIPEQLKKYLTNTKINYSNLSKKNLHDIEETYIFYDSLYHFDKSHFSECVILTLQNEFASKNFNYSFNRMLDKELMISPKYHYNYTLENLSSLSSLFQEITCEFLDNINRFNLKEEDENDLKVLYKQIGMLEIINIIIDDENCKSVLVEGKEIIEGK